MRTIYKGVPGDTNRSKCLLQWLLWSTWGLAVERIGRQTLRIRRGPKYGFLRFLSEMELGAHVALLIIGVDGFITDTSVLKDFQEAYKHLKITVVVDFGNEISCSHIIRAANGHIYGTHSLEDLVHELPNPSSLELLAKWEGINGHKWVLTEVKRGYEPFTKGRNSLGQRTTQRLATQVPQAEPILVL